MCWAGILNRLVRFFVCFPVGRGGLRSAVPDPLHLGRREPGAARLHDRELPEPGGPCVAHQGALLLRLGGDLLQAGHERAPAEASVSVVPTIAGLSVGCFFLCY